DVASSLQFKRLTEEDLCAIFIRQWREVHRLRKHLLARSRNEEREKARQQHDDEKRQPVLVNPPVFVRLIGRNSRWRRQTTNRERFLDLLYRNVRSER